MNYITPDQKRVAVRTAAILTTSYVAGTALGSSTGVYGYNQLVLYVTATLGSLTSIELRIRFSDDGGTTFWQETDGSISAGTSTESLLIHQFTASGSYRLALPISDPYIEVAVKGTGTVTSSSCTVTAILARN